MMSMFDKAKFDSYISLIKPTSNTTDKHLITTGYSDFLTQSSISLITT